MSMETKTTVLHDWHVGHGANMAAFGEYDMPLWYPLGAKGEHLAVINSAGLFDTSHMAVVTVAGEGASQLLQKCFSKDLEHCIKKGPLTRGRSVYGLFLTPEGHVLDDTIISLVADGYYMVVVNSGMGETVAGFLSDHKNTLDVDINDLTDKVGKIDIQGQHSAKILSRVIKGSDKVFKAFPYFSFKGWYDETLPVQQSVVLTDGTPIMLSRTGYTGEFGFEIFIRPDKVVTLWQRLLDVGDEYGITPCGLAARDSLRAGAVLPLSHQDIGDWPFSRNPWPFAVADSGQDGGFTKAFIGSQALASLKPNEFTFPFAGFDPRKVAISATSHVETEDGVKIGSILTCTTDMAIGRVDGEIVSVATENKPDGFTPRGLSCGFVKVGRSFEPGDVVVLTDGKRRIKVEIRRDVRPDRTARRPMKEML